MQVEIEKVNAKHAAFTEFLNDAEFTIPIIVGGNRSFKVLRECKMIGACKPKLENSENPASRVRFESQSHVISKQNYGSESNLTLCLLCESEKQMIRKQTIVERTLEQMTR